MGRFDNINPLDLNAALKLNKFIAIIATEAMAGRLEKKGGSFDWKNEKGWELPIKEWEPLVPTHGNFAGPGYSCGQRGEFSYEQIRDFPVAEIYDRTLGRERNDYVDIIAKEHDLAYVKAKGASDYWEKIRAADRKLVTETQKLLDGTSQYFSDGGKMTPGESAYAETMLDGFKIKLVMMDEPAAVLEKFKNSGYGKKEINDLFNNVSQGMQFFNPRDLLRKLNLSDHEIQEIEQKYAAYCEENGLPGETIMQAETAGQSNDIVQTASASNQHQDEYEDEDRDYYYGPGMG